MKAIMNHIENRAVSLWGFENWKTITIFRLTAIMGH